MTRYCLPCARKVSRMGSPLSPWGMSRSAPPGCVQRTSSQLVWASESALLAALAAAAPSGRAPPMEPAQPASATVRRLRQSSRQRNDEKMGMAGLRKKSYPSTVTGIGPAGDSLRPTAVSKRSTGIAGINSDGATGCVECRIAAACGGAQNQRQIVTPAELGDTGKGERSTPVPQAQVSGPSGQK
ncbi:hypothetical protein D3C85_1020740 [compost metagenome]